MQGLLQVSQINTETTLVRAAHYFGKIWIHDQSENE